MNNSLFNSLARANGWGSAGQCPAHLVATTPASRARDIRVAALLDRGTSTRATVSGAGGGVGA